MLSEKARGRGDAFAERRSGTREAIERRSLAERSTRPSRTVGAVTAWRLLYELARRNSGSDWHTRSHAKGGVDEIAGKYVASIARHGGKPACGLLIFAQWPRRRAWLNLEPTTPARGARASCRSSAGSFARLVPFQHILSRRRARPSATASGGRVLPDQSTRSLATIYFVDRQSKMAECRKMPRRAPGLSLATASAPAPSTRKCARVRRSRRTATAVVAPATHRRRRAQSLCRVAQA